MKICEMVGCTKRTREDKPFCTDHIEQHPYVRRLLTSLAASQREIERVRLFGAVAVTADSNTVAEIMQRLWGTGPSTTEALHRALLGCEDLATVESYIYYLRNLGWVRTRLTTRKNIMVHALVTREQIQVKQ